MRKRSLKLTGIELTCLRETIGIKEAELANYLRDFDEVDIKVMEHGVQGVNPKVAEETLKLREIYSLYQESALSRVDEYIPEQLKNYSSERINIAVFTHQKNYEKYINVGSRAPLIKLHRKTKWKIKEFIEKRYQIKVNLIQFQESNYLNFLHTNNMSHDQSSISKWAASIGDPQEYLEL